jgi:monoterpene epsilon-lactone hydrolase
MQPKANISSNAQILYDQMLAAGIAIPTRDNILNFRADLIADSEPDIRSLIDNFDGVIEEIEIASIPCKQITPASWSEGTGACVQYAYGGGYVSGSTWEDQVVTIPMAELANVRVIMVDYRLSPECPFPGPQQDMQQVYPALVELYGASRLIVSGESAGGNQAVALMQFAREKKLPMPVCAVLFSPWVDLSNNGDSHIFNDTRDPTLNNAWVDSATEMHANSADLDNPGLSPLFADMHGLPPCIITTGSRDLLLSQCLGLAQKLREAGVECDLRVWEGMWHVFEFYAIPEAKTSLQEVSAFIRAHI